MARLDSKVVCVLVTSELSFKFPFISSLDVRVKNFKNCEFKRLEKFLLVLVSNSFKRQIGIEAVDLKDEFNEIWDFSIATF